MLRYPTSGYADNALWQGAGLYATAFQQSSDASDRQQAERLLKWLRQEYPSSPFLKKIDAALQALGPAPTGRALNRECAARRRLEYAAALAAGAHREPASARARRPSSKGITETALPHGERITIEFSQEVTYTGDRVDSPDRVFFDFANSTVPASLIDHAPAPTGSFIKALRLGRHANGVTRIVLELSGSPRYSVFPMYNPFRFVIDLESADAVPPTPATMSAASPTSRHR